MEYGPRLMSEVNASNDVSRRTFALQKLIREMQDSFTSLEKVK